jgi:signal peptidase I
MEQDKLKVGSSNSKRRLLNYLVYLLPVALIIVGYFSLIAVTGESEPFTIVNGMSMEPTILPASIALIDRVPFDQLKAGDVIVFRPYVSTIEPCDQQGSNSPANDVIIPCYVIHRIIAINTYPNGTRVVTTKGDNNPGPIGGIDTGITQSMYVGEVVLQFPLVGYLTYPPYPEILLTIIFVVLIIETSLQWRTDREQKKRTAEASEKEKAPPQESTQRRMD